MSESLAFEPYLPIAIGINNGFSMVGASNFNLFSWYPSPIQHKQVHQIRMSLTSGLFHSSWNYDLCPIPDNNHISNDKYIILKFDGSLLIIIMNGILIWHLVIYYFSNKHDFRSNLIYFIWIEYDAWSLLMLWLMTKAQMIIGM